MSVVSTYQSDDEVKSDEVTSLVELLGLRARRQPDARVYTFLVDGDTEEAHLTYGELDRKARSIAALLRRAGAADERALLLYPPGLDYVAAFFGCLYAGCVAVPAYPPQLNRPALRLQAIAADSQAKFALTTANILSGVKRRFAHAPALSGLSWMATDGAAELAAEGEEVCDCGPETLAFLQYTSGSTATPKGVMLSHGNLLHNSALIRRCFDQSAATRSVIWLPPYHDMGLIGGLLQPLYSGYEATLMAPAAFLARPFRWLQAISRRRATTSGGPNFAYDLCVRSVTAEQKASLDLSHWEVAFNGAEPIRAGTLERFAEAFAPCGFRLEAFRPCYGLAEATLLVTGARSEPAPVVRTFLAEELGNNRAVAAGPEAAAKVRPLVSSGGGLPGQRVVVVNPVTRAECGPGEVGEVWVSGPSVARGYWSRPEESEVTFGGRLVGDDSRFLRTGDLGFFHEGSLFVTGRVKDLIVIRGRNHYPQDIELSVERSHPALRRSCGAAFCVEAEEQERLVVVQEVDRRFRNLNLDAVVWAIRQAVAEHHELQVFAIALVRPGSIPKTSSGKVQRHACREQFLGGTLEVIRADSFSDASYSAGDAALDPEAVLAAGADERPELLRLYLRDQVARALRINPDAVDARQSLGALGIDSLTAIGLKHTLEAGLQIELPVVDLLQGASVSKLTAQILTLLGGARGNTGPLSSRALPGAAGEYPLSAGQRALWFLHQLAPESSAYNIASAARIRGRLDVAALRGAFRTLVERHPSLRTRFGAAQGIPRQQVLERDEVHFVQEDLSAAAEAEVSRRLVEEAHRPFDLVGGPLFRVNLFRRSDEEHLLLIVAHHIVIDLWSLAVLTGELDALYASALKGEAAPLDPLPLDYSDFVSWQDEALAGPAGEALWEYWRQKLGGELSVLNLPTDRPRPLVQTYRGAHHTLKLGRELTREVKALSRVYGVTLYMTLLAAFQALLYRYTGQSDILVGTPSAGRTRPEFAGVVGYFVNPLVMRAAVSGGASFEEFLGQVRQTVWGAFEHQDYPFALLAERLQPARDPARPPVFQVMFSFQKVPLLEEAGLPSFILGEPDAQIALEGLTLEHVPLEQQTVPFDLTMVAAETPDGIGLSLQYNSDLFDGATAARMLDHFQILLEGAAADPARRLSSLPLLRQAERNQVLTEWNNTLIGYRYDLCIHQLYEAQAARTPEATALVFEERQISYGELNRLANGLAWRLRALGVGPEVIIGLCAERSPEMVVGMLGILKAGGAYLPLDPALPVERLTFMLKEARVSVLVTQPELAGRFPAHCTELVYLDAEPGFPAGVPEENPEGGADGDSLAYVLYTSGSTGRPKGVQITHSNVVNFFAGMDQRVGCGPADTMLAVTSISFDISVLELLWTLTSGAKVVVLPERAYAGVASEPAVPAEVRREVNFSLFYFASDESGPQEDKYRLLIEGAKFADANNFAAVWTPERHFHAFGGLYPNPSVMSAGLATITQRVQIRAGSVVLPLHHPVRVAEEWSLVDNLSRGRVGLAFASGWHADDFVFAPGNYEDRKEVMFRDIEVVRKLWRGEAVRARGGGQNEVEVRLFPRPVQPELPVWITAAGSDETFVRAGRMGANVLTHLLGQTLDEVEAKIRLYRRARAEHGHDPEAGQVTLMLHTFVGEDRESVREKVREPFTNYLRSSVGLIANLARSLGLPFDPRAMSPEDMDALLAFAFDRYFETSALFGSPASCRPLIERLRRGGVDEVACLIDFGVEAESALAALQHLKVLKDGAAAPAPRGRSYTLAEQAARHGATMMQCTPSLMRMVLLNPDNAAALKPLRALLLGGEALPASLAKEVRETLPCRLINMYGPTETTIWSATHEVEEADAPVPIGRPVANTQLYVLNEDAQLVPVGVCGELYIGGDGLSRGYLDRPGLTAERFVPNPFSTQFGARLYRTGDLASYAPDGSVNFLGRADHQVKLHGFRIELGEIEVVLGQHALVREAVVTAREDASGGMRLVAYVVPSEAPGPADGELREFLRERLPDYMVPAALVQLEALPHTANGKVDRKALPAPEGLRRDLAAGYVAPRSGLERTIASVWQKVLNLESVGVHDNFFDLGGHSLLMVQVHAQLSAELNKDLPLIRLLEHPSVSSLAKYLTHEDDSQNTLGGNEERARRQREGLRRQRQSGRLRLPTPA